MKSDGVTLARALDWVNQRLKEEPDLETLKTVDAAAMKYNLGPLDTEWLLNQLRANGVKRVRSRAGDGSGARGANRAG